MMRVLLTGGSGFLAGHILTKLLERGHFVVTTVRSQSKLEQVRSEYKQYGIDRLDFAIVEDVADPHAFDKAVVASPPFDVVIHTASPFTYQVQDIKKDLLDPAVVGTTGILQAVHTYAPSVSRMVITSSFAAICDFAQGNRPGYVYSEKDWNPITFEEAEQSAAKGYQGSKTLAERAAWEFMTKMNPTFSLTTINPPMIFGPVAPYQRLSSLNMSSQRLGALLAGEWKAGIPATGLALYADARDVATAHVAAAESRAAGGNRFFICANYYSNAEMASIVENDFPEYREKIPADRSSGERPKEMYGFDNSRAKEVLGISFMTFEDTVKDIVKSLKVIGA